MARNKHIALATQDPEATAKFYIDGLGLKEVGKLNPLRLKAITSLMGTSTWLF